MEGNKCIPFWNHTFYWISYCILIANSFLDMHSHFITPGFIYVSSMKYWITEEMFVQFSQVRKLWPLAIWHSSELEWLNLFVILPPFGLESSKTPKRRLSITTTIEWEKVAKFDSWWSDNNFSSMEMEIWTQGSGIRALHLCFSIEVSEICETCFLTYFF
jgi:hypothetical protein